jgi:ribose transport system permease protein
VTAATLAPPRPHSRAIDLLLALYLAGIVVAVLYPSAFLSPGNASAVLNNLAFDGILAVGMMLLMIAGVFDLSVGAMASMTGVLAGWLMVRQGWPVPLAVAAALLAAGVGGFVNGVLVAKARVNALITTLGTLGIFQGITILVGGPGVTDLPAGFTALGQTEIDLPLPRGDRLHVQTPVFGLLVLALVAHLLLQHTGRFRQFYYVGSNPKAARLSGIRVERLQILGFTLMGLIAGVAGLAYAARVGSAVSTVGQGAELRVITAVILGGASLTGGKGSVPGALVGVLFMALVTNVLIIARVSSYWQGIVIGVILVLAVGLDAVQTRRRGE